MKERWAVVYPDGSINLQPQGARFRAQAVTERDAWNERELRDNWKRPQLASLAVVTVSEIKVVSR